MKITHFVGCLFTIDIIDLVAVDVIEIETTLRNYIMGNTLTVPQTSDLFTMGPGEFYEGASGIRTNCCMAFNVIS